MKTVRVRIAVAVDRDGAWVASGWSDAKGEPCDCIGDMVDGLEVGEARSFVEADVPLPEQAVIEGEVKP